MIFVVLGKIERLEAWASPCFFCVGVFSEVLLLL
jgi:hypothetical protein